MVKRLATVSIVCFSLVGCVNSVRVNRSDSLTAPPKGIPFYAKTGVCKQETVWLEPQYILSYETKSGTKTTGPFEKVLSRKEFLQKSVQDFIATPGDIEAWKSKFNNTNDFPGPRSIKESDSVSITKEEADGNWVLVSNTGAVEAVVDYGNVFYLNSARPLAGTTQVDAKLAADGTLSEGSAQVNDQTLATIASTISSLVSSASSVAKILGIDVQVDIKVTVKTKVYKHTHSQYLNLEKPATPSTCPALSPGVFAGSFAVTEVTDSANTKATTGDNTITVSGSIVLPKTATIQSPAPVPTGTPATPKK